MEGASKVFFVLFFIGLACTTVAFIETWLEVRKACTSPSSFTQTIKEAFKAVKALLGKHSE